MTKIYCEVRRKVIYDDEPCLYKQGIVQDPTRVCVNCYYFKALQERAKPKIEPIVKPHKKINTEISRIKKSISNNQRKSIKKKPLFWKWDASDYRLIGVVWSKTPDGPTVLSKDPNDKKYLKLFYRHSDNSALAELIFQYQIKAGEAEREGEYAFWKRMEEQSKGTYTKDEIKLFNKARHGSIEALQTLTLLHSGLIRLPFVSKVLEGIIRAYRDTHQKDERKKLRNLWDGFLPLKESRSHRGVISDKDLKKLMKRIMAEKKLTKKYEVMRILKGEFALERLRKIPLNFKGGKRNMIH